MLTVTAFVWLALWLALMVGGGVTEDMPSFAWEVMSQTSANPDASANPDGTLDDSQLPGPHLTRVGSGAGNLEISPC